MHGPQAASVEHAAGLHSLSASWRGVTQAWAQAFPDTPCALPPDGATPTPAQASAQHSRPQWHCQSAGVAYGAPGGVWLTPGDLLLLMPPDLARQLIYERWHLGLAAPAAHPFTTPVPAQGAQAEPAALAQAPALGEAAQASEGQAPTALPGCKPEPDAQAAASVQDAGRIGSGSEPALATAQAMGDSAAAQSEGRADAGAEQAHAHSDAAAAPVPNAGAKRLTKAELRGMRKQAQQAKEPDQQAPAHSHHHTTEVSHHAAQQQQGTPTGTASAIQAPAESAGGSEAIQGGSQGMPEQAAQHTPQSSSKQGQQTPGGPPQQLSKKERKKQRWLEQQQQRKQQERETQAKKKRKKGGAAADAADGAGAAGAGAGPSGPGPSSGPRDREDVPLAVRLRQLRVIAKRRKHRRQFMRWERAPDAGPAQAAGQTQPAGQPHEPDIQEPVAAAAAEPMQDTTAGERPTGLRELIQDRDEVTVEHPAATAPHVTTTVTHAPCDALSQPADRAPSTAPVSSAAEKHGAMAGGANAAAAAATAADAQPEAAAAAGLVTSAAVEAAGSQSAAVAAAAAGTQAAVKATTATPQVPAAESPAVCGSPIHTPPIPGSPSIPTGTSPQMQGGHQEQGGDVAAEPAVSPARSPQPPHAQGAGEDMSAAEAEPVGTGDADTAAEPPASPARSSPQPPPQQQQPPRAASPSPQPAVPRSRPWDSFAAAAPAEQPAGPAGPAAAADTVVGAATTMGAAQRVTSAGVTSAAERVMSVSSNASDVEARVAVRLAEHQAREEAEREVATRREEVRGFVLERLQARYGRFLAKQDLVGFLREIGVSVEQYTPSNLPLNRIGQSVAAAAKRKALRAAKVAMHPDRVQRSWHEACDKVQALQDRVTSLQQESESGYYATALTEGATWAVEVQAAAAGAAGTSSAHGQAPAAAPRKRRRGDRSDTLTSEQRRAARKPLKMARNAANKELEAAQEAERKAFERVVWAEEVSKVLNAFPMP